jgi:ketosteroid isomerase-like protein
MAYAGWGGKLVYAGALLTESYDLVTNRVGLLLGGAAIAYFPGTFAARRRLEGDLRSLLAGLAVALALGVAAFGALRPSALVSTGVFAVLILLAGARGIAGSAFGLNAAPEQKVTIGSIRAAATQLGYLAGAAGGGIALDLGGYPVVGLTLAGFFAAAATPHLSLGFGRRSARGAQDALAPIYAEWRRGNCRSPQPALAWGFSPEFPDSEGVRMDPGPRSERLAEWLRQWHDWRVEPERFVDLPCRTVVMTRYKGRGRASGVGVDTAGAHVWTIRDDKPVVLEVFADRELALQAGARPCGG